MPRTLVDKQRLNHWTTEADFWLVAEDSVCSYSYGAVCGLGSSGNLALGIPVSIELMHHTVIMATDVHSFRFVSVLLRGVK
jgi:hypothetical protein